jgi:hypothetical protein
VCRRSYACRPGPGYARRLHRAWAGFRQPPRQALPAVRRVSRRCLCIRQTATLPGLKPVLDSSARSPPHQRCEATEDRPVHSDLVDLRSSPISTQNAARRAESAICTRMSGSSGRRMFTLRNRNRLARQGRPSRRKQSQSWRRVAALFHEGAVGVVWHRRPAPAKQCERGQDRCSILCSSALMLRSGGVHLKRLGPAAVRHADEETCAGRRPGRQSEVAAGAQGVGEGFTQGAPPPG